MVWRSIVRGGLRTRWVVLLILIAFVAQPVAAAPGNVRIVSSRNWAGYAVDAQDITLVHAAWTVPTVKRTGGNAYSSSWIGIGGTKSDTLIQAGTAQEIENGQSISYAWIELLPQPAESIAPSELRVRPGDKVGATIRNTGENQWQIKIENASTGQHVIRTVTYASCRCSAEWIEEQPTILTASGQELATLANFGAITFSDAYATVGEMTLPLTKLNLAAIDLRDAAATLLAAPGELSTSGNHFTITYAR